MYDVSSTVQEIDAAFFYIFAVSGFFLVAITLTMVWFVVRYNRRRNPVASDISGHLPLEIAWTVIPTLLAFGMFYYGWLGFEVVRNTPPGAIPIEVTGRMFFWTFSYENGRQTRELYVPVGKPVRLDMQAMDVNHSFYIPAFKIKEDLVPGQQTYMSFTALRDGIYDIQCAEFCGTGHSTMLTRLHALPAKDFDLWLKKPVAQQPLTMQEALAASPKQLERGQAVYGLFCASCHGKKGDGSGVADARRFTSLENWKNGSKVAEVFRTLEKGLGKKMPSFGHLPIDDRFAVVHYLRAFAEGHPTDSTQEIGALDQEFSISTGRMPKPELPIAEAMRKIAAERKEAAAPQQPKTDAGTETPFLTDVALGDLRKAEPRGGRLYAENCARCHGDRGQGGRTVKTLDENWRSRLESLALNLPGRPWRAQDAEGLRRYVRAISISTGGLMPDFGGFSAEDWQVLHRFILGLAPDASASSPAPGE